MALTSLREKLAPGKSNPFTTASQSMGPWSALNTSSTTLISHSFFDDPAEGEALKADENNKGKQQEVRDTQ